MELLFKSKEIKNQWDAALKDGLLIVDIVNYFVELSINDLGIQPMMTSFLRDEEDQIKIYGKPKASLHMYRRAADMRSFIYTDEQIKYLVDKINAKFEYDPSRPGKFKCAIAHKITGGAYHFHLQVHPNTATNV